MEILLLSAPSDRKVTSGIIELCHARVQKPFSYKKKPWEKEHSQVLLVFIDHGACFFDVGFAYPGGA